VTSCSSLCHHVDRNNNSGKNNNNKNKEQQQQQQQQQQRRRFTHSPELVVKTEDRRRMAEFPLSTSGEKGEEGRRLRRLLSRRDVARRSRMAQTLAE
jgi:TFIIF-interacting CTD phosphatase-like protein